MFNENMPGGLPRPPQRKPTETPYSHSGMSALERKVRIEDTTDDVDDETTEEMSAAETAALRQKMQQPVDVNPADLQPLNAEPSQAPSKFPVMEEISASEYAPAQSTKTIESFPDLGPVEIAAEDLTELPDQEAVALERKARLEYDATQANVQSPLQEIDAEINRSGPKTSAALYAEELRALVRKKLQIQNTLRTKPAFWKRAERAVWNDTQNQIAEIQSQIEAKAQMYERVSATPDFDRYKAENFNSQNLARNPREPQLQDYQIQQKATFEANTTQLSPEQVAAVTKYQTRKADLEAALQNARFWNKGKIQKELDFVNSRLDGYKQMNQQNGLQREAA